MHRQARRSRCAAWFESPLPVAGARDELWCNRHMTTRRSFHRSHRARTAGCRPTRASGRRAAALLLAAALSACVTLPPPAPEPAPVSPAADVPVRERACPSCDDQNREIARLRQDLAQRDADLRDLRSSQRDQVKVIQESTREVARAKVKLRRLATQADAASYIAEVEVGLQALRNAPGAPRAIPLQALAEGILQATAAPFAQGDYGAAMDLAAQAEQLVAVVADERGRRASPARVAGETTFQVPVSLRVTADSKLRRQPLGTAAIIGVLPKESALIAHAYKGSWLRVETASGRAGWVEQTRLGVR